jgi:hypothetical protein
MTKKKNPLISKSEANRCSALQLKEEKRGMFSEESRLKMQKTRSTQGLKARLRNPLYVLPHLKVVYLHYHLKTNEFFWCGQGNWKRPYKTGNRTKYWKEYIEKRGSNWEVCIVQSGLNKEMAWWLEKNLTIQIGTIHNQTGTLLNHDGKHGLTKQSEQKISRAIKQWHHQKSKL